MFFNRLKQKLFSKKLDENIKFFSEGKLSYLAPIFCVFSETDDNAKLTAAKFLLRLLTDMSLKKLLQFADNMHGYNVFGNYSINWQKVTINDLVIPKMSEDEKKAVFIWGSFHSNGLIREKAVKELSKYAYTLKYILLRRNDWVLQVRAAAKDALEYKMKHLSEGEVVDAVPAFEKLQNSERDNFSSDYDKFITLLRENKSELNFGLNSNNQQIRLFCAKQLLQTGSQENKLAQYLRREKSPHNRAVIYNEYIKTVPNDSKALINQMLSDRYAKVRIMALNFICTKNVEKSFDIALDFLLDANASVRATARFFIKQRMLNFSFRDFYFEKLKMNIQIAVAGLGESGRKEDAELLEIYLNHSSHKIVRITIRALVMLNKEKYLPQVVNFLDDNRKGLVKEATNLLLGNAQPYAKKIKDIFSYSNNQYNRIKCSKLLFSVSKWDALIYMLESIEDSDPAVSNLAKNAIDIWITRFNRSFIFPTIIQKNKIIELASNLNSKDFHKKELLYLVG